MKTFKFRLYPTSTQAAALDWTLARCCELYNAALQERKEAWNACRRHPNFYDPAWRKEHARDYRISFAEQCHALTVIRNEVRKEYQQVGSHVLQNVLRRVDRAFDDFFGRVRRGQTQKVDALRTVIGLIVEAHDEATARAVLDSLLTA
jgi:putative transposase